jgi:MFS family permease
VLLPWDFPNAFLTQAVSFGILIYSYSVIGVALEEEFRVSRFQLMLPMTAMVFCGLFIAPWLGPKMDRHPIKWFLLTGALFLSAGLVLMSWAPSIYFVVAVYALLFAPAQHLVGVLCCSVLVSRWFVSRLALPMGLAAVGTSAGGFFISPLIEWLNDAYGWREGLRYLGIASLVLLAPLALLASDRPQAKGLFADGADSEPDVSHTPAADEFDSTSSVLRNRQFWLLALTMALLAASYNAILSNLMPLVMAYGIGSQDGALLISVIAAFGVAGKLLFGAVADRIDMRYGLAVAVVLVISGVGLFLWGSRYTHFVIASAVLGLSVGGILPVWGAMTASLFGAVNYGRVMGLMSPIPALTVVLTVPLTGFLFDVTGGYLAPFSLLMVLLAISLCWIPAIVRKSSISSGEPGFSVQLDRSP